MWYLNQVIVIPLDKGLIVKSFTRIAAIGVAALLPLTLATPALAVDFDRLNFTVDCLVGETGYDDEHYLKLGETLVVTLENCAGYYVQDDDNSGTATMTGGIVLDDNDYDVIPSGPVTLTITTTSVGDEADIDFDDRDGLSLDSGFDIDIDIRTPGTVADPDSTLLFTEEIVVPLDAEEMMIREEMIDDSIGDDGAGFIYLGADESCRLEPGLHVYEELDLTVTEAGVYDFRTVATSPLTAHMNWGIDRAPSSDTFLAVYDNFDPANPDEGVVGCNDDADSSEIDYVATAFSDNSGNVTESGDLMQGRFPWFQSELTTGEYTLVKMFFQAAGADDFAIGEYDISSGESGESWDPAPQGATFELWGPEGGLELGHALADTGVNPAFALWSGLALAGTGVAITAARRRAQRA
jgi:hypothetical protein